jgi:hypothetical protein
MDHLDQLIGLQCSAARIGVGRMLSFELGNLDVAAIGEWSLWLQDAQWRIETKDGWAGSGDEDERALRAAIQEIVGSRVTKVTLGSCADLTIELELGTLRVFVDRHDDGNASGWILYGLTHLVYATSTPPYVGREDDVLRDGPDDEFVENVGRVFGQDAARRLRTPNVSDLILPKVKH